MNDPAAWIRPGHCSEAEWALRRDLAHCYHLMDYMGWAETIFNHISVRLPGAEDHYLINPFGLHYTEVTPANLLKIDLSGQKVENPLMPSPFDANPAGFALHAVIHEHREDVRCVIHTHTTAVSAIAQKAAGFDHNNFYGAQIYGRVGYHDFEGITLFDDEKPRMLTSLGDKHVLVLRNHGVAVAQASIAEAFFLLWTVQRAAEIQCASAALPGPDSQLSDQVREKCAHLAARLTRDSGIADKTFAAMVRKMQADRGTGG